MKPSSHVRLLAMGVGLWAAFFFAGWPAYYQQYSFETQLIASIALVPAIAALGGFFIRRARPERRRTLSLWLSFYSTAPFALLDTIYCGGLLGHGPAFITRYWYLSVFYVIPWLLFVPIGRWAGSARL